MQEQTDNYISLYAPIMNPEPITGRRTTSYLLIAVLFIISNVSFGLKIYAQTWITGNVKTTQNIRIPVSSIKVLNSAEGASGDTSGNFSFKTALYGRYWIFCSAVGFKADSTLCIIAGDSLHIYFRLQESHNELSQVNVSAARRVPGIKKENTLNDFDVATTAGAVADVAAALRTFPGASPAGNETGLFVHGGAANETKAFFDGMLVKNPFGSKLPDIANRSRFSAFLFDKTTFTTGGYTAEYGEALSSAMIWESKGLANTTSTEVSIISLGIGAAHTERFKNSSLVVGGNLYDFKLNDQIVKQNTAWQTDPKQSQGMVNYKLKTKTGMFKVFADYSDTRLSFDINNPITNKWDFLSNNNRNLYFNANYKGYVLNNNKVFFGIAYNYTKENGLLNEDLYDQKDKVWQAKIALTTSFFKNDEFTIGAEQFQTTREEKYIDLARGYSDRLSAGFAEEQLYLGRKLFIKAGLRAEYSTYMKRGVLSPRTGLTYLANPKNSFTLEFGTYYQKPDDSFLSQTAALEFEKAYNYSLEYNFKVNSRNLRIQSYYKKYLRLTKIVTPVFSGFQAYGPPLTITSFSNDGYGYAKGIDVLWRDQKTFAGGEYYISYSYLNTKRNYIDFPVSATPPFAPENTLNIVGRKFLTAYNTQLSVTYTFSSGRTYFNPVNPVFMAEKTQINNNLSLGASYLPAWFKQFVVLNFTLTNVLGLNQVYGYRYSFDGKRQVPILPPSKRGILVSFLMNIGDGSFNH